MQPGHDYKYSRKLAAIWKCARTSSIKRALVAKGWSKKSTRQQARERNADLREWYLHSLSDFQSYQLVYVDESGCDKRVGFRRTGCSPLGVSPMQVSQFHHDQRYKILPAYAQDGTTTPEIAFHTMCIQSWFQTLERQDILFRIWLLPYCCLV